jgi:hypothetical protein
MERGGAEQNKRGDGQRGGESGSRRRRRRRRYRGRKKYILTLGLFSSAQGCGWAYQPHIQYTPYTTSHMQHRHRRASNGRLCPSTRTVHICSISMSPVKSRERRICRCCSLSPSTCPSAHVVRQRNILIQVPGDAQPYMCIHGTSIRM